MKQIKVILIAAITAIIGLTLTACSLSPAPTIKITDTTVILDTRPLSDYTNSHIESALEIDFSESKEKVIEKLGGLRRSDTFILYGSDGAVIEKAYMLMSNNGFIDLTNAGSMESASAATGLPIVNNNSN